MPFPFLPIGAIVAASILVGALTAFGLLLRWADRAATRAVGGLRGSVLPGLVSGMRGWTATARDVGSGARSGQRPASPISSGPSEIEIVDLDA